MNPPPAGCALSSARPPLPTKTIDFPIGRPHEDALGSTRPGGRVGALPSPFTSRCASSARSPRGPHANGPAFRTAKRHVTRPVAGSSAHARPSATNDAVASARTRPRHTTGRKRVAGRELRVLRRVLAADRARGQHEHGGDEARPTDHSATVLPSKVVLVFSAWRHAHEARARARALLGSRRPRAAAAGDDRVPPQAALPPGAVARGQRAPHRFAADRAATRAAGATRREPPPARLRAGDRRELPHRRRTRRGEGANVVHRAVTRASITSACGPTSCRRPRSASTSSATWPPTSGSPTGPSTRGGPDVPGTVREVRFAHSPGGSIRPTSATSSRSTSRSCSTSATAPEGIVGVVTVYHDVNQPAATEADPAAAVSRDHRVVGHLRAGGDRRGQRDRAHPHLARPPARAVDAPAPERRVALGSARRRPPRRQHRLRRRLQPVPGAPRRRLDVRLGDPRGAPRRRCPPRATTAALRERYLPG